MRTRNTSKALIAVCVVILGGTTIKSLSTMQLPSPVSILERWEEKPTTHLGFPSTLFATTSFTPNFTSIRKSNTYG